MITVELMRAPNEARHSDQSDSVPGAAAIQGYERVARLRVYDDGTYDLEDPHDWFPLQLHVLVVDEGSGPDARPAPRKIRFEDEPYQWAANVGSLMRTGYLVPVIEEQPHPTVSDAAPGPVA